MAFTREQLDYLVKLGPIDKIMKVVRPTLGYGQEDWFKYSASELAGEVLRERARAEAAEDKLHDVEEDFDTLELELKATHDRGEKSACELVDMKQHVKFWQEECRKNQFRAESAEAERDILQWASDHAGKGECEKCGREGVFKSFERAADDRYRESIAELREVGDRFVTESNAANVIAAHVAACEINRELLDEIEPEDVGDWPAQRPHEALVWAMFFQKQMPYGFGFGLMDDALPYHDHSLTDKMWENADRLLEIWRARWPEPKA